MKVTPFEEKTGHPVYDNAARRMNARLKYNLSKDVDVRAAHSSRRARAADKRREVQLFANELVGAIVRSRATNGSSVLTPATTFDPWKDTTHD